MLKNDTALTSLRLIFRELLRQDYIDLFVTVQISVLVPVCFGVILKTFHVKKKTRQNTKIDFNNPVLFAVSIGSKL